MSRRPQALLAALDPSRNASRVPAMLRVAGCDVTAVCPADTSLAHSWLVDRQVAVSREPDAMLATLRATVEAQPFDFVVLADEALLLALATRLEPWMERVLPFAADARTCGLILDKNQLLHAMERAGVPLPPFLTVDDAAGLDAAAERIGYPLMLKDAVGCGGDGVRRVDTPAELHATFASLHPAGAYTVQRFFRARSGCTDVLFDHGVPRCWTSAYMLEQWPTAFDPATVREPVSKPGVEPMLHAVGAATGFHGLGGVDWIEDERGALMFLEFNARVTHVVGPARPAFGREIGALIAGVSPRPHEVLLPPRPVPVFPAHFVRALKARPAELLTWLPLRASSADLDWRDTGVIASELGDMASALLRRVRRPSAERPR